MNRREAIQRAALLLGGSLFGADTLLARNIDWERLENAPDGARIGIFSKKQIRLLNEIAETIIPTTNTPGAKAAKVGQFAALIVSDCYEPDEQKTFMEGLAALDKRCEEKFNKCFLRCAPAQRHDLLSDLDREQKEQCKNRKAGDPLPFFRTLKDLCLWGYFTSEIGATQALRMVETPGRYDGNLPYKKGDRAWGGY